MAQRLVRTLCPHCKEPIEIEDSIWQSFTPDANIKPTNVCKPVGCIECRQTGYLGRIGLYEMLEMTDSLEQTITADVDLRSLRKQVQDDGLLTLRHSGTKKVAQGFTTIEEVMRVTPFTGA